MFEANDKERNSRRFDQASRWLLIRSREEGMTDGEKRRFLQWLNADEANIDAYAEARALYGKTGDNVSFTDERIDDLLSIDSQAADAPSVLRFPRSTSIYKVAAALIVVGLIGFFLTSQHRRTTSTSFRTAIGEIRNVSMSDGSRIEMDTATELVTTFSDEARQIQLDQGRAVFDVTHDPDRTFEVQTDYALVRVTGTVFEVAVTPSGVGVTVAEGRVEIIARTFQDTDSESVPVHAGQFVDIDTHGNVSTVAPINPRLFARWTTGIIEFINVPLSEAVAEMNRYFPGVIEVPDPKLQLCRISGSFSTNDPFQYLTALEQTAPIHVVVVNDNLIRIENSKKKKTENERRHELHSFTMLTDNPRRI